jgi:hypothetical protein
MSDKPAPLDQQAISGQKLKQTKAEREKSKAIADYSRAAGKGQPSMSVKVHSPYRSYFDGPAFSISAVNRTGPFDILPKHHNFISLLNACDLVVRTIRNGERKIRISGGIMHVKSDKVIVFLDV